MLVFFLGKSVWTAAKTMVVDRKGTSSAIFGVAGDTAAKCCEIKRCAERVRSRTDNKKGVLEGKFSPSNKKGNWVFFFLIFLPKIDI